MKAFRVTGSFEDPRQRQKFSIEMSGKDEASVRERALSTLGSRHKLKRPQITITEISEVPADQVVCPVVRYEIGE
ncbi:MAG: 50S ribosomal protein L18a [Euryarchaeota archaeon]|jgi:large subunit ribosomal protein LX|nr:50S ribosomal protein L18a [Euryarchaeota archaeon]